MMPERLLLAFSGGLDTTYCTVYLSKIKGYDVTCALVNTGAFTIEEIDKIEERAKALGAKEFVCLNVENEYYEKVIKYLIFGNVLKNGTYPLSVSSERIIQALALVRFARQSMATCIAHGSTAAGNDQVRFDLIFNTLAPDLKIITPIREQKLSRQMEIEFLQSQGFNINFENSLYSINKGIWGTSIGGKETLNSLGTLPEEAFTKQLSKSGEETVTITFKHGEPVAINDMEYNHPLEAIRELEEIASAYAIGRDIHVGDTIIGIKGRVGFEAAAAILIIKSHQLLEKHTLSKTQLFWKDILSNFYGNQLHEGLYLEPFMRDVENLLNSSQRYVNGKVHLKLEPKRFELLGIESENDLMSSKFGRYGEENKNWTYQDVLGFTKIYGNQLNIFYNINNEELK
jgi:argininosuccinate synthase